MTEEEPIKEEQKETKHFYSTAWFWAIIIASWIIILVTLGIVANKKVISWAFFWVILIIPIIILIIIGIVKLTNPSNVEDTQELKEKLPEKSLEKCRASIKNIIMKSGEEITDFTLNDEEGISPEGEEGNSEMIYSLIIKSKKERSYWMAAMRVDNHQMSIVFKTQSDKITKAEENKFEKNKKKLARAFKEYTITRRTISNPMTGTSSTEEISQPSNNKTSEKPAETPLGAE